jgi:hypothetical protein
MINKPNIQEKIDAQKSALIKRLIADFKIPVIDIKVDKNSEHSFSGIFFLVISSKLKIDVGYNYSNKIFDWNVKTVSNKINGIWRDIYLENKGEIDTQILKALQINDELEIKEINTTKKNMLIVYKKNIATHVTIQCDFIGVTWKTKQI